MPSRGVATQSSHELLEGHSTTFAGRSDGRTAPAEQQCCLVESAWVGAATRSSRWASVHRFFHLTWLTVC